MKFKLKFLVVLICISGYLQAEDNGIYHQLTIEGLDYAYNLQTDKAVTVFDRLIKMETRNPRGYVLQSINYFYRLQWQEEDEYEKKFNQLISEAIKVSKKGLSKPETRLDALFYLGTSHVYLAAYHASKDNWLRAYWFGKEGIKYLERVIAIDSTYYDAYLGLGLYHYYADVIPKFIKSVASLLGINGNREKGLDELQLASQHGVLSKAEALLFLGNIYLYTEKETEKALNYSKRLTDLFPSNPGFWSFLGENYQRNGEHERAIEAFEQALATEPVKNFPIFEMLTHYNLGNTYFELNDFTTALRHYNRVVNAGIPESDLTKSLKALSYYKVGLCSELIGDNEEAKSNYQAVKKSDHKEAYEQARKRLKEPLSPVAKELYIGRNFVRSKQYENALAVLDWALQKCLNGLDGYEKDKIPELNYNRAKAAFEMKNYAEAVKIFKGIFDLEDIKDDWIMPWSHFYLGQCYEELGQYEKALAEYEQAHDYDDNDLRFRTEKKKRTLQSKASATH